MKKILFLLPLVFFFSLFSVSVFALEGIDINTASLSQLDEIIGIGHVMAQRIIDMRPFSSIDDLLKVKGIGEKTLQKIKDQGLAYVNGNPNDQIPNPNQIQNPNDQKGDAAPIPLTPTPIITYPSGLFINEILPSPQGADETEEWFEVFNSNNFDVDLSGWQVKDTAGTITTYAILKDTKILANGYLIFKRPETKIMLNNEEDGLNLLMPDGKITDSVIFTKAPIGQSYNKTSSEWQWSKTLTPGTANIIVLKTLSNQKKSGNSNKVDENFGTASINNAVSQTVNENLNNTNPWLLFLTALTITIVSTIVVLLIKFRVYKNKRETPPSI